MTIDAMMRGTVAALALVLGTAGTAAAAGDGTAGLEAPVVVPVETAAGAYLAGRTADRMNDLAAAAAYYDQALGADPNNRQLRSAAFQAHLRAGSFKDALALARRINAVEEDGLAKAVLIVGAMAGDDWSTAIGHTQDMERAGIAAFTLPLMEAWARAGAEDPDGAVKALTQLTENVGFAAIAATHEGMILELSGDLQGARAAYERALAEGEPLRLAQALGRLYRRMGDLDAARALYRDQDGSDPENLILAAELAELEGDVPAEPLVGNAAEGAAEALYQVGSILEREGALDLALVYGRMALALRPDFPLGQLLMGDILLGMDRPAEAHRTYAGIDPGSAVAWPAGLQEAEALAQMERPEEAAAMLDALAEERPDRSEPLIRLGDLQRSEGEFDASVEAYDAAFERAPDELDEDWTFLYRRGISLERAGQWDRAERDLTHAIAIEPDHAHLLNYLGYSWVDRGEKLAEGEELILKAVELAPDDGYIVDSLGWVYYRTGRLDEAVETLERAVELLPEDPTINDHLGDAYWMVGRRNEARFQWRRALRMAERDEPDLILPIEEKLAEGLTDPGIMTDAVTSNGEPAPEADAITPQ